MNEHDVRLENGAYYKFPDFVHAVKFLRRAVRLGYLGSLIVW